MNPISQRKVATTAIPLDTPLESTLYHQSATPVLAKGQRVTEIHLRALKAAHIECLYECRCEEDILDLAAAAEKQSVPVSNLPVEVPIPYNVYSSTNGFLLRKGGVLTQAQYRNMLDKGVTDVRVDSDTNRKALLNYQVEYTKLSLLGLEKKMCSKNDLGIKTGVSRLASSLRPHTARSTSAIASFQSMKAKSAQETSEFLNVLQSCKTIDINSVTHVAGILQQGLSADVNLSLGAMMGTSESKEINFAQHSSKVATLATAVGLELGYNDKDMKDLGLAALIHEVGMLALPTDIVNKKEPLTESELSYIRQHPVLAMDTLRRGSEIPERVILSIYQEHESPNRLGYPNRRPGHLVHDFSKIIAVCDAYEAMISERPYRSALLPYHVVEQMVKATGTQRFDGRVIKALLTVIGLFPVGSWVKLSNDNFARVVANNPDQYDKPVINVLFDSLSQPLAIPEFINLKNPPKAGEESIHIVDVVNARQFPGAGLLGF